ncbi:endonuclease/exonuclease/phosphatase family protein [bacterium]|nr:endonuclease/exonuclease/phosphatase family protein [bacterium]
MKRKLFGQVLVVALAAFFIGCAGQLPRNPAIVDSTQRDFKVGDTIKIVTWNVQHFVDPYDSPYIDNEFDNDMRGMSPERIDLFVEAIKRMDADVIVFEEFEKVAYLHELAEERFPEMEYWWFGGSESWSWHQNVVFMSRVPLGVFYDYSQATTPIEDWRDDDGRMHTQNFVNNRLFTLEVLPTHDYNFLLTGVHLKASSGPRNEGWRKGQIRFLRGEYDRVLSNYPDTNIVLMGDLNAEPDTKEFDFLLHGDGDGVQFVDPLGPEGAPTAPTANPRRRIDCILMNTNMAPELLEGSLGVAMPLSQEEMAIVSDHLPVSAEFRLNDQ